MSTIQPNIEQPVSEEMQLVRRAKRGDDAAFEELVRRYDRNVFRIAQHITQNREDAEDVVQEAFLKAYGNLAKFQEQSKFYTWLVRIAVNEALMKLRRRKPERTVSLDEGSRGCCERACNCASGSTASFRSGRVEMTTSEVF